MRTLNFVAGAAAVALVLFAGVAAQAANFSVTLEAPGVQNSTANFASKGVENFNSLKTGGNQSFSTDYGTGGAVTGVYSGVDIRSASKYGGAGGSGNFASTTGGASYSVSLSTTNPNGINYFGFDLSALDAGNSLSFFKGNTLVFSFTPTTLLSMINGNSAYFGNPNADFQGQDKKEAFAFVNFFDTAGTFDKVVFSETPKVGEYESDNQTVGFFTQQSGTTVPGVSVSGVPEPATWAMTFIGLGCAGASLRSARRTALQATAA